MTATGCAPLVGSLAVCNGFSLGTYANLTFRDDTPGAVSGQLGATADGATIHITVNDNLGNQVALQSVTSSAPNVLKVVGFSDDVFTLHAGSVGTSKISVTTSSTHDAINLKVERVASTAVYSGADLDESYFLPNFAMSPGADVGFRIVNYDATQKPLTGFGATPVSATPVSSLSPAPDSDAFDVVAPSNAGSTVTLDVGSSSYDVEIVNTSQATSLDLLDIRDTSGATAARHSERAVFNLA